MAEGSGILDPLAPLSYAFGGGGVGMSLEEVKRRRAVQLALAAKARGFPKNIGEGLTSLGEALGDRRMDNQLNEQERALQAGETKTLGGVKALPGIGTSAPARTSALDPAADAQRNQIAAYYAGGQGGATPNPTVAAGDTSPQATLEGGGPSDDPWPARLNALGGMETGGRADAYSTVGKAPTKYGHALGRYGVVEANVGPWTQAALGQALTPQQFLNDSEAQDAVAKHRLGRYIDKFGEEGAARAWFGGPGNVNNTGATDAYQRLNIGQYGQDYMRRLGAKRGAAIYPAGSMAGSGAPVAADENPATATDIAAAPAPMLVGGSASAAAGDGPDAAGSETVDIATGLPPRPAAPVVHGVRVTGDTRPLDTPIPPPSEQTMPHPGPEPTPPARIEFSPRQQRALELMNDRNISESGKAFLKQQFEIDEKIRTEMMQRRETDYTHNRQLWEKRTEDYNKFMREAEDRKIEQSGKRLTAEKTQADIRQANRTLYKPDTFGGKGTQFERPYDPNEPPDKQTATYSVPRGLPAPDEKITESQAKTVKFMQRAVVASSQLGDASVLAGLADTAKGKVLIGGNYWVSPEYQKAQNAAFTWTQAVLRDESGAVLGAGEIANKMKAYFPQPGDNEQTIRDKAFRRRTEEESFYHALGDAKPVIDKWREERKTRRVPVDESGKPTLPEGTLRINNRTGVRQRVMGGHWENEEDLY